MRALARHRAGCADSSEYLGTKDAGAPALVAEVARVVAWQAT